MAVKHKPKTQLTKYQLVTEFCPDWFWATYYFMLNRIECTYCSKLILPRQKVTHVNGTIALAHALCYAAANR